MLYKNELDNQVQIRLNKNYNNRLQNSVIDSRMLEYLNKKDAEKVQLEEHKKELLKNLIKDGVFSSLQEKLKYE